METAKNIATIETVADLKSKWDQLKDVDRAVAVHKIHTAGISYRQLAKEMGCSESLLRHLNLGAQAPPTDQFLARHGKISSRELARRGKAERGRRRSKEQHATEEERRKENEKVAEAICDWLKSEGFWESQGESIVDNARAQLNDAELSGNLTPLPPAPPGTLLNEIIQKLKPPPSLTDGADDAGMHAAWLVRWVYFALPDSLARHRALNLALDMLSKG